MVPHYADLVLQPQQVQLIITARGHPILQYHYANDSSTLSPTRTTIPRIQQLTRADKAFRVALPLPVGPAEEGTGWSNKMFVLETTTFESNQFVGTRTRDSEVRDSEGRGEACKFLQREYAEMQWRVGCSFTEALKSDSNKPVYFLSKTASIHPLKLTRSLPLPKSHAARMSFYRLKQFQCEVTGLDYSLDPFAAPNQGQET